MHHGTALLQRPTQRTASALHARPSGSAMSMSPSSPERTRQHAQVLAGDDRASTATTHQTKLRLNRFNPSTAHQSYCRSDAVFGRIVQGCAICVPNRRETFFAGAGLQQPDRGQRPRSVYGRPRRCVHGSPVWSRVGRQWIVTDRSCVCNATNRSSSTVSRPSTTSN
jgi:hypothetical protein